MRPEGLYNMKQWKNNAWERVRNSAMPEALFNGNYSLKRGENKYEGLEGSYTGGS